MKIAIYCDELYPYYGISLSDYEKKRYSLSDAEYADYERVSAEWEAWQAKLAALKPDDYVAPKPPTEEELELIRLLSSEEGILLLQSPEAA